MAGGTGDRVSRVSDFSRILSAMDRRVIVALSAALVSCASDEEASFTLPTLGTPYALFGTAAAGRAIPPSALRVIDTEQPPADLRPEFIAGSDVDVVWAGIDPLTLPGAITPEDLVFVRSDIAGTRALPPLLTPYVLRAPSPPDRPEPLVDVEAEGLSSTVRRDRMQRLEDMLADAAVEEPCRRPQWTVNTPRIPSDSVVSARVMSDGSTVLGLATTSTAVLGVVAPGSLEVDLIGVGSGPEVVPESTRASVRALDGDEVRHASGALVPSAVTIIVQSGIAVAGSIWLWSSTRWLEDTPLLEAALPRSIGGLRTLEIDGVPSLCAIGTAQGSSRPGAIWCRPQAGGEWQVDATFDGRFGVTELTPLAGGGLLAADRTGTVYRRAGTEWVSVFDAPANQGCMPPCLLISLAVLDPLPGGFALWLAGEKLQLLRVVNESGNLETTVAGGFDDVLFADERPDAAVPTDFQAATMSPDGALWLATNRGFLIRRDPTGGSERVCLPDSFEAVDVGAIVAHDDGRLLVSGSPVLLAQTSWRP